jgi:hypothetical protein
VHVFRQGSSTQMWRQVRDAYIGMGLRCTRRDGSPTRPGGAKAPLGLTHGDFLMHEQPANSCKIPKLYASLMRVTNFATRSSLALAVIIGVSLFLPGCGSSHPTPPMVTPPPPLKPPSYASAPIRSLIPAASTPPKLSRLRLPLARPS